MNIPLPGDKLYDQTVIASVYFTDEEALLLLLNPTEPYFEVATCDLQSNHKPTPISTHHNIIPAVRDYEQNGGDY